MVIVVHGEGHDKDPLDPNDGPKVKIAPEI
jgi:hypothetical protein